MVVSHYVVSSIQVAGLVVGLLGFFYLSLTLFGRTGFNLFRPLLPASAVAIAVSFMTLNIITSAEIWKAAAIGVIGFVAAYWLACGAQFEKRKPEVVRTGPPLSHSHEGIDQEHHSSNLRPAYSNVSILVLRVLPLALSAAFVILVASSGSTSGGQLILLVAIVEMFLYWPAELVPMLSQRRLQYVGFTLSILAILTQFIPPVLDLLNIPVR
jgi:hypothetical protein